MGPLISTEHLQWRCSTNYFFVEECTLVYGSPVKKLQQGCYEEVHRMGILIHQEGEPAKEVHNPADGVEH